MNSVINPKLLKLSSQRMFRHALLEWFDANRRALPWRENRDPYRIWVSEIMLQQTRVAVVIGYFERFMARFPDVRALASADEETVLALWSGLGYYRRARALYQCAKRVVHELEGEFPRTEDELRKLPGIGRYTGAAIASIAFGQAVAVVDGNVERVLSRLYSNSELSTKGAKKLADQLLDQERPGDFNQAMMELGATVCTPAQPLCPGCPVRSWCQTRGALPSAARLPRVRAHLKYFLSADRNGVWLVRRPQNESLMPGMWELPLVSGEVGESEALFTLRHSITQTDYTVIVFRGKHDGGALCIPCNRLKDLPLTGLTRKILRRADII